MHTNLVIPHSTISLSYVHEKPQRIDRYLAAHFTHYSRNYFQKVIADGHIKVNGISITKTSLMLKKEDALTVYFPPLAPQESTQEVPANLGVKLVYQHNHFLIIAKPAGLMVHKASPASTAITLVDWLVHHFNEIKTVGQVDRPGIVHRLDKDTSGLMIVPRNPYAHAAFGELFKNRKIKKTYTAIVMGYPEQQGVVDYRIDRDRHKPHKMTHVYGSGREATTYFTTQKYLSDAAIIEASPVTGRTHQIRVHCAAIGHPIIGDPVYGKKSKLIERHALHASKLAFSFEGVEYSFEEPTPNDMIKLIEKLH